jgi:NAD(P)-dependent dehydrogenase (short-subunit alcohol dehydrogenase family)
MSAAVESRAAIVTGGATGIGLASARRLAARGFDVLICSRTAGNVEAAVEALQSDGLAGRVEGVVDDVADPSAPERLVAECASRFGRLDALVNNAGVYAEVPFLELTAESWDETVNINLRAAALTSVAAAREMIREGHGGRIVHIASLNAILAEPGMAHYGASKAGVISLAQSMAVDLAEHDIQTNAIAPGWIRSRMTQDVLDGLARERLACINPQARAGEPDEIATVVEFLCADAPAFLNGETIFVDGGQTIMAAMP